MEPSDPERIWACTSGPMVGLYVSGGNTAGWPEYIRTDIHQRALDEAAAAERAKVEHYRSVLAEISDLSGEINPSNYDHDDACELNRQFCYAITLAASTIEQGHHHDPA